MTSSSIFRSRWRLTLLVMGISVSNVGFSYKEPPFEEIPMMMKFVYAYTKPICDEFIPGFQARTSVEFEEYRQKHSAAIKAAEANDPEISEKIDQMRQTYSTAAPYQLEDLEKNCLQLENYFIEANTPTNPQFLTIVDTWEYFLAALREGDTSKVLECLSIGASPQIREFLANVSKEKMAEMADDFESYKIVSNTNEKYRELLVRSKISGTSSIVLFSSNKKGEWKINQM